MRKSFGLLVAVIGALGLAGAAWPARAMGQLLVPTWTGGTVGEYSFSGQTINSSLIPGLGFPGDVVVSGNVIYELDGNGFIGTYNLDGSPINPQLITGLVYPTAIAVAGSDIFVTSYNGGEVSEFSTSGQTINNDLFSIARPFGIAASGGNLYVVNVAGVYTYTQGGNYVGSTFGTIFGAVNLCISGGDFFVLNNLNGSVGEYAPSGLAINSDIVSGIFNPWAIAVNGQDIYVTSNNYVGEYTTSGQTIGSDLFNTPGTPYGIAVLPEPGCLSMMGLVGLLFLRRRRLG